MPSVPIVDAMEQISGATGEQQRRYDGPDQSQKDKTDHAKVDCDLWPVMTDSSPDEHRNENPRGE